MQYTKIQNKGEETRFLSKILPRFMTNFSTILTFKILHKFSMLSMNIFMKYIVFIYANSELTKCGHLHDIFVSLQAQPLDKLY